MKVLFCWLGNTDIRASQADDRAGLGPIVQAVSERQFDLVMIISDFSEETNIRYSSWFTEKTSVSVHIEKVVLTSPTSFGEIYESSYDIVNTFLIKTPSKTDISFHLSPGTPAMAAVWIILAKTKFSAELIESSAKAGVKTVSFPFDISAEYLPALVHGPDEKLQKLSLGLPPEAPEFDTIIHRSAEMKHLIAKSRLLATRNVPVLIQGESGTGKELLARAIHKSGLRKGRPFVAVNCGAIPEGLLDSEFFGYEKGAFTGAVNTYKGYFEAAHEGTLFLDEIGELPLYSQVKLLRAIQEMKIVRLGSVTEIPIDIRIVAATNRNLIERVSDGEFREDLFHRIAVGTLYVPPLRDRKGDLSLLIDAILSRLNEELSSQPGVEPKSISPGAKRLLLNYHWPGNVRELHNVLMRCITWGTRQQIQEEDIRDAIIPIKTAEKSILNRPLGDGFDIQEVIADIVRHYFNRANEESGGKVTKSATLLGFSNYQTFANWKKKYNID